jgi:hypothetical protein
MKIKLVLSIILYFAQLLSCTEVCSPSNCKLGNGECVNNICLCGSGYTTFYSNNNNNNNLIRCNYDYKYKEYAAYYEAVLPFGVGHFYSLRYFHSFIKFTLFWFLSTVKLIFKKEIRLSKALEKTYSILIWVFAILYVIDYIGFTFSFYTDGNGMTLY